jgi:nicotinate-nucleotide pyrophosphorylase (carboxylating)
MQIKEGSRADPTRGVLTVGGGYVSTASSELACYLGTASFERGSWQAAAMTDVPVDPPIHAVRAAVSAALAEDLTPLGDLSAALVPADAAVEATFATRADGVLAGTACAGEAFAQIDDRVVVRWDRHDGDRLTVGDAIGTVSGPLAAVLTGERTALNFLCHLSGIATLTRRFADAAAEGGDARIWDTRKTTPGLRSLEKAAVRAGGGASHRGNLSDWVMFKDNHLAAIGIEEAVPRARAAWPARTIHVEVDDVGALRSALAAGCDAVLLDNFTPDQAAEAVAIAAEWADEHGGRRPLLECSGGITTDTAAAYAATGVDLLSTSQITQSAPALDIGLDVSPSAPGRPRIR